ncbi:phage head-tail connector protein [Metabacillus fastidiosus]|uniref:phage head-tail connector protein n=1 Tax=Metabacillus fastidiosus TaxID=1458 RepID=UPI000824829C|nr:phage head-tail connector protein [Metabacillus fastidiosus]MED4461858.1 hypothetical protein [Metabacillus fastidiosus]
MWKPTPEEIKEIKGINRERSTVNDDYYGAMLPILLEHVEAYCNNSFRPPDIPGGVKIFLAKAIEHNQLKTGLKSRSMGSVSYSYDLEFPETLYKYLRPYKKVKFHASR